jgi:hypothetical protein
MNISYLFILLFLLCNQLILEYSMSAYGRAGVDPKSAEGRNALPFVINVKGFTVVNVRVLSNETSKLTSVKIPPVSLAPAIKQWKQQQLACTIKLVQKPSSRYIWLIFGHQNPGSGSASQKNAGSGSALKPMPIRNTEINFSSSAFF